MLDGASGKRLGAITGLAEPAEGLAVSPDGRLLAKMIAAAGGEGIVTLWKTE